jgi:hypothetical protein
MTLWNDNSSGNQHSYYWAQGTQWGLVGSTMTDMGSNSIGVFVNYAGNNCVNGSAAYNCGGTPSYANVAYQALLGNSLNGSSPPGGYETLRIAACRMCVIANNLVENAGGRSYAVMKLHGANTYDSRVEWIGQYTELVEISDNLFYGTSGAQLVETAPQNAQDDERLRNIVVERNVFAGTSGVEKSILVSAVNETLRDNAFNDSIVNPTYGAQVAERGIEPVPQGVEIYNNTCYAGLGCAGFDGNNYAAPGINSYAENNLFFGRGHGTTVFDGGSGNTVSNNTVNVNKDPGFANASGTFLQTPDFTPSGNYSGGASLPVLYDALGMPWPPIWDLGALHH